MDSTISDCDTVCAFQVQPEMRWKKYILIEDLIGNHHENGVMVQSQAVDVARDSPFRTLTRSRSIDEIYTYVSFLWCF